jgi:hypothetical protein
LVGFVSAFAVAGAVSACSVFDVMLSPDAPSFLDRPSAGVHFSTRDGTALVLWELSDPKEVEYFEGREVPPENRPEAVGEFDAFWRFGTKGDGLSARSYSISL